MEILGTLTLIVVFIVAAAISGGVDDEPRGSIEARRYLSKNGYLPLA